MYDTCVHSFTTVYLSTTVSFTLIFLQACMQVDFSRLLYPKLPLHVNECVTVSVHSPVSVPGCNSDFCLVYPV